MMKYIRTVYFVVAVAAALLLVSCGKDGPAGRKTNVVVITLDTTRQDVLGPFGNKEVKTPALDALAADSVLFDECFTVINCTNPSHLSIFTSMYAKDHGITSNFKVLGDYPGIMPRAFKAAGYRTAGFVSTNHLGKKHGFDQGYDDFFDTELRKRPAADTTRLAADWLKKYSADAFFVWVHYFDPHTLYQPPPPFDTMYDKKSDERVDLAAPWRRRKLIGFEEYFTRSKDPEYYRNLYKGEVSYMDSQIGVLIARLKELGVYDDTLIIVVADHGESLGEHGRFFNHTQPYDPVLKVPLMFKMPGGRPTGMRGQLVSTVDIYPTVLGIAGIPVPGKVRGRSLGGIIADPASPELNEVIHSESTDLTAETIHSKKYSYLKYFVPLNGENGKKFRDIPPELYDIGVDSGQLVNIAGSNPELVSGFERDIAEFMKDRMSHAETKELTDKGEIEKLKSLGYVN